MSQSLAFSESVQGLLYLSTCITETCQKQHTSNEQVNLFCRGPTQLSRLLQVLTCSFQVIPLIGKLSQAVESLSLIEALFYSRLSGKLELNEVLALGSSNKHLGIIAGGLVQ